MNKMTKFIGFVALSATFAMAEESFGGIGISYKACANGAEVLEVIPETPAAAAKLQAGDQIIAIDGASIKGFSTKGIRDVLRGVNNKPVVVTYISEGDTLETTLRRAQMTVKSIDDVASAEADDQKLLALLSDGKMVDEKAAAAQENLKGVYVENPAEVETWTKADLSRVGTAKVCGYSRDYIRVKLEYPGAFAVSVANADGNIVARMFTAKGTAGVNVVRWDGSSIPEGRYVISVESASGVNGVNVQFK